MIGKVNISAAVMTGLWLAASVGSASAADQSRYSSGGWQDPSATNSWNNPSPPEPATPRGDRRLRRLLKELRSLIRDAAQDRAADPRFLGDLRQLVRRYDLPQRTRILFDNFSDGNLSHNPIWRVSGTGVNVSSHTGLRMRYAPHLTVQTNQNSRQSSRDALIGSLLGQLTGHPQEPQQPQRRQIQSRPPRIAAAAAIPNAFAIELTFGSSSRDGGRFVVGVTQGRQQLGYRLAYNPGSNQPIELIRRGKRGAAIIDATQGRLKLEDAKLHKLRMARDRRGEMTIGVDGKVLIRTVDRTFGGDFDGVVMINQGGDYTIRSVRVDSERL